MIVVLNNTVRENRKAENLSPHTETTSLLEEQMAEVKWKLQLSVCWDQKVLK